jgi:maltooligosyltrehalose trehalohydrolase
MLSSGESLRVTSQGVRRTPNGVSWCVWAPLHQSVKLSVGLGQDRRLQPMLNGGNGYRTLELPSISSGQRYAFQLGDSGQDLPDPSSRWQPDGVHRPSAVFFPDEFEWHDSHWGGLSMQDLAIYELHVGTFTDAGTFAAIIPRLAQLKALGVTAIEIMPVAQFPGGRNWGYDGVHPYAVQNSYGGPRCLQELVDAAHKVGLGILLDVVYNHLGPEGNYLGQFGPYFTSRYHSPWGAALNFDGADSDPVRQFVIDNACQWIRDFHIDGLRLDAVQTIYDMSAFHLLAELQAAVQKTAAECGRTVIVIAESNQNDARITAPADDRGHGLDGVWSDDFHHCVHAMVTGERDGYFADFGEMDHLAKAYSDVFTYDGCYKASIRRRHGSQVIDQPRERFVVCVQNHDQIGNRASGDRIATLVSPSAQRLAAALMLISPNTPLLFMGEEYGETNPFAFFCSFEDPQLIKAVRAGRKREFQTRSTRWDGVAPDADSPSTFEHAKLSWKWEDDLHRAGLRQLYQTLLSIRHSWPLFKDRANCRSRIIKTDDLKPLLYVARGEEEQLIALANLTDEAITLPIGLVADRPLLLSTEHVQFGGLRNNVESIIELRPHELAIWGEQ